MMPKSAVADSATITRLWAFLLRRRLISISVLRLHGGLRRDHHAVARGIPDDGNPGLEQKRDLDGHIAAAGGPDARAVPDGAHIGRGGGRRARTAAIGDAGIDRQRKTTAQLALHRRDHVCVGWQRRIEGDRRPRPFPGRVGDGVVDVNGPAEVDGPQQQHEEHRCEHRELHHRLTAVAAPEALAHQYSALNHALVLMVSWPFASPTSWPMIGVMKVNLKLADTWMGYCAVPWLKLKVLPWSFGLTWMALGGTRKPVP